MRDKYHGALLGMAIDYAAESSRTTPGAKTAIDACRYFTGLIIGALQNRKNSELIAPYFNPENEPSFWDEQPLDPKISAIAAGSFKSKEPPNIKGSGYVVESLEAALWAFSRSDSFREGALLAVNLGDDADTTGAIYGQLTGAFYGKEAIPAAWKATLAKRELIIELADRLYSFANSNSSEAAVNDKIIEVLSRRGHNPVCWLRTRRTVEFIELAPIRMGSGGFGFIRRVTLILWVLDFRRGGSANRVRIFRSRINLA